MIVAFATSAVVVIFIIFIFFDVVVVFPPLLASPVAFPVAKSEVAFEVV